MKKFLRTLLVMAGTSHGGHDRLCQKRSPQREAAPEEEANQGETPAEETPAMNLYWEPSL